MLNCWLTDEQQWPKDRTREMFREWFDVQMCLHLAQPDRGRQAPLQRGVRAHLYKDGDTWQSTQSFGRHDLLLLAKVADLAHTRVLELPQESNGDDNGAAK